MSRFEKIKANWLKTIQEYKDNSTLYAMVFVSIVIVTILTWGALKVWVPSSFESGMAYLLLPLIVLILAPTALLFVVVLFLILVPVWAYISLLIKAKEPSNGIIDPSKLVDGLGFEQCVDGDDDSIPNSLLMRSFPSLSEMVYKRIFGGVAQYLYFAEHNNGYAVAFIQEYSKEVSFPTCVINSKINDAVLPLNMPIQASELFSYIPTDAEKLLSVKTSTSNQKRVMQLLSPEVVLSYMHKGLQFDAYMNGNTIELAFAGGNNKDNLVSALSDAVHISQKLYNKVTKDTDKSSSIRWRLSNEARVVYKHLDKYFFRSLKTIAISTVVFVVCFGISINTASSADNLLVMPLFIISSFIGGLAFLYGVFGFVANFALLGYTFAIHSLFSAINKAIVILGANRAKRAHSYLGIKYSFEE